MLVTGCAEYQEGEAKLMDEDENADIGWFAQGQVFSLITSDLYPTLRDYILKAPSVTGEGSF